MTIVFVVLVVALVVIVFLFVVIVLFIGCILRSSLKFAIATPLAIMRKRVCLIVLVSLGVSFSDSEQ